MGLSAEPKIADVINETARNTAAEIIAGLKRENMVRTKRNAYQKIELLLYNYSDFKKIIKDKEEQIKSIAKNGLTKKSKDITSYSANNGEYLNEMEKNENEIENIEKSIQTTRQLIKLIDAALAKIQHDPYFAVIQMFYIDGISRDDIAAHLECDVRTVARNKKRLVDAMKMDLFSGDYIAEIYYS